MEMMDREGWAPVLELWTEAGTPMQSIMPVHLEFVDCPHMDFSRYVCRRVAEEQALAQLQADGYSVSEVGLSFSRLTDTLFLRWVYHPPG